MVTIKDLAADIHALEHRARCKTRKGKMACICASATAWASRIQESRGAVIRDRPPVLSGKTVRIETGSGRMYVTVNLLDDEPFEVFCRIGKPGEEARANAEEVARLVSLSLRAGIPVHEVVSQLRGIQGPKPVWWNKKLVGGIGDAIGLVLSEYTEEE